ADVDTGGHGAWDVRVRPPGRYVSAAQTHRIAVSAVRPDGGDDGDGAESGTGECGRVRGGTHGSRGASDIAVCGEAGSSGAARARSGDGTERLAAGHSAGAGGQRVCRRHVRVAGDVLDRGGRDVPAGWRAAVCAAVRSPGAGAEVWVAGAVDPAPGGDPAGVAGSGD